MRERVGNRIETNGVVGSLIFSSSAFGLPRMVLMVILLLLTMMIIIIIISPLRPYLTFYYHEPRLIIRRN